MYYDKALQGDGNHRDMYYFIGTEITRQSDCTVVNKTTSDQTRYMYVASSNKGTDILYFDEGLCIEFDIIANDGNNQIELFCDGVGASRRLLTVLGHYRIEVGTKSQKIFVNDVEVGSYTYDFSNKFRVTFLVTNTFSFKDLKIYPI